MEAFRLVIEFVKRALALVETIEVADELLDPEMKGIVQKVPIKAALV